MEVALYVVTALMLALGLLMALIAWARSLVVTESEREGLAELITLLIPLFVILAIALLMLAAILNV